MRNMQLFTGRTLRWFRQQIGITRGQLARELSQTVCRVQHFEMGRVKNSLVSPSFAARYGLSIEAITAWRQQKTRRGKPVSQAMEMLDRWEQQTLDIIETERRHAENS